MDDWVVCDCLKGQVVGIFSKRMKPETFADE